LRILYGNPHRIVSLVEAFFSVAGAWRSVGADRPLARRKTPAPTTLPGDDALAFTCSPSPKIDNAIALTDHAI